MSKQPAIDLSKLSKTMKLNGSLADPVAAMNDAATKFIEGAIPEKNEEVIEIVQEPVKAEPSFPWESIDPNELGKQTAVRLTKSLTMKLQYVNDNTRGGIVFAQVVRDCLEAYADQMIHKIQQDRLEIAREIFGRMQKN